MHSVSLSVRTTERLAIRTFTSTMMAEILSLKSTIRSQPEHWVRLYSLAATVTMTAHGAIC